MNEIILFDAGLVLRASTTTLGHADLSLSLWNDVQAGRILACIAQQTVWEFFSVLTRLGISHGNVVTELKKHLAVFPIIAPGPQTFENSLASLSRHRWIKGAQVYDLYLAHTAVDNGISILYTFNDRHFRRFKLPLRIVNPSRL